MVAPAGLAPRDLDRARLQPGGVGGGGDRPPEAHAGGAVRLHQVPAVEDAAAAGAHALAVDAPALGLALEEVGARRELARQPEVVLGEAPDRLGRQIREQREIEHGTTFVRDGDPVMNVPRESLSRG